MGKLALKSEKLFLALDRLAEAVVDLEKYKDDDERRYRSYRDSCIKRFEFVLDLFWKYIKLYLDVALKLPIEINAPKPIVREACKAKLVSPDDAETILKIIDDRNMSSHIYKEEIADQIGARIPASYELMKKYAEKLSPRDDK